MKLSLSLGQSSTFVLATQLREDTRHLGRRQEVDGAEIGRQEGALGVQEVPAPGLERGGVEHVQAAEEQVVRVHQVIVDLRVLACRTGRSGQVGR